MNSLRWGTVGVLLVPVPLGLDPVSGGLVVVCRIGKVNSRVIAIAALRIVGVAVGLGLATVWVAFAGQGTGSHTTSSGASTSRGSHALPECGITVNNVGQDVIAVVSRQWGGVDSALEASAVHIHNDGRADGVTDGYDLCFGALGSI